MSALSRASNAGTGNFEVSVADLLLRKLRILCCNPNPRTIDHLCVRWLQLATGAITQLVYSL